MSTPNVYFGRGSHMSAVLKADIRRVRAAKPEFFTGRKIRETSMDGDGRVTTSDRLDVRATAPKPAHIHAMAMERR